MATNRLLFATSLLVAGLGAATSVESREAASPSACQAAAATPAIADAKSAVDGNPNDLETRFKLADAWSDAGCFSDAVQVLQGAADTHSGNKELETRLRVARSLVGEEHFFDNIDRADAEARLKRASFRCTNLSDVDACSEALRLKPDDPALLVAQGDSLVRAKRPADALNRYRLAAVIAPNQHDVAVKIATAEGQLPAELGGRTGAIDGAANGATGSAADGRPGGSAEHATPVAGQPGASSMRSTEPPLRAASIGATGPTRRYSNAAPEAQSH